MIVLSLGQIAQAQNGALKGKVYLSEGKAHLDSVDVYVVGADTSLKFVTRSTSEGQYEFIDLPPSEYEIEYSKNGFKPIKVTGIFIRPKTITFQDAILERSGTKKRSKKSKGRRTSR